jgi:hypothetical protein
MKLILTVVIVITACSIIVWAFGKILERVYNMKARRDAYKYPDATRWEHGIVYNTKEEQLEADQSPITPF